VYAAYHILSRETKYLVGPRCPAAREKIMQMPRCVSTGSSWATLVSIISSLGNYQNRPDPGLP